MKMKAYILFFFLTVLTLSAQAQITTFHGMVSVKENKIELRKNNLSFDLNIDLSGLSIGRYQTLTIMPMLREGRDSLLLPPIVVNGANKHKMYKRSIAFRGKAIADGGAYVVIENNPKAISQISYKRLVPYNPWMKGAQLILVGMVDNYDGEPQQTYVNVLIDKLAF